MLRNCDGRVERRDERHTVYSRFRASASYRRLSYDSCYPRCLLNSPSNYSQDPSLLENEFQNLERLPVMAPPSSHEPQSVNPGELYNAICDAASQDPVKIKNAYDKLKEMLEMVGTFDTLSQIAAQRDLPLPVRKQSIIQLKNSSLNHWRSRRCVMLLIQPCIVNLTAGKAHNR